MSIIFSEASLAENPSVWKGSILVLCVPDVMPKVLWKAYRCNLLIAVYAWWNIIHFALCSVWYLCIHPSKPQGSLLRYICVEFSFLSCWTSCVEENTNPFVNGHLALSIVYAENIISIISTYQWICLLIWLSANNHFLPNYFGINIGRCWNS